MKKLNVLFIILLCLLVSILTSTSVQALSIATSEAEITNVTLSPSAGTLMWTGPWWVQAGAFADDYKTVFDTDFDDDSDNMDGVADASASTTLAESKGHADGNNLTVRYSTEVRADSATAWSNADGFGELFNTFIISGGTLGDPVDLTASFDYSALLSINTEAYGPIFDSQYVVRLAISDGLTDWILMDEKQIIGGPGINISIPFGRTISNIFELESGTPYNCIISADAQTNPSIPEPSTIFLFGILSLIALPIHLRQNLKDNHK